MEDKPFRLRYNQKSEYVYCHTLHYPDGTKLDEYCQYSKTDCLSPKVYAILLKNNKYIIKQYYKDFYSKK